MLSRNLLKDNTATISKSYLELVFNAIQSAINNLTNEAFPTPNEERKRALYGCVIQSCSSFYYPTYVDSLGAVLFNVTRGHILENGNKRSALFMSTLIYRKFTGDQSNVIQFFSDLVDEIAQNQLNSTDEVTQRLKEHIA